MFTHNVGSRAGEVGHVEVGEEAEGGGSRPVDASARISPAGAEYLEYCGICQMVDIYQGQQITSSNIFKYQSTMGTT